MSNPNQVGGTLCISIASTALFGGYLRSNMKMRKSQIPQAHPGTRNRSVCFCMYYFERITNYLASFLQKNLIWPKTRIYMVLGQ